MRTCKNKAQTYQCFRQYSSDTLFVLLAFQTSVTMMPTGV